MDLYKDYDSKGKRLSPEAARQIRSQLNKNHIIDNLEQSHDQKLQMELKQLMHELNKQKGGYNRHSPSLNIKRANRP